MTDLETYTVFLPIAINNAPPAYGVQLSGALTTPIIQDRIYHVSVAWQEPQPWIPDAASVIDTNPLILGTRTCPPEYRLYPDRMGSEPKPEYYSSYVNWLKALCERYHPYAVEVWNEPDCPTYTVPAEQQYWYGAWVTQEDYFAAGRRYGKLLGMAYEALHPMGVQVLGGALMNGAVVQGREFLRGMLETGECDYVSMHIYPWFGEAYGLIVSNAIESVRQITDKPLFITETSLLTKGADTLEFQAAQVEYLRWFREYMAWSGTPWLWYAASNEWYKCGLYRNGIQMPVWDAWSE